MNKTFIVAWVVLFVTWFIGSQGVRFGVAVALLTPGPVRAWAWPRRA